jgi:hypothetical protein
MAKAICLKCGNEKTAAFADCAKCGFDPAAHGVDKETQARSLLLSDQFTAARELERLAAELRAGRTVPFDPQKVLELVEQLSTQKITISKGPPAAVAAAWLPWAAAIGIVAVALFWWLWPKLAG